MIGRWLGRVVDRVVDGEWLREMRRAEVLANRSAARHERMLRRDENILERIYLTRHAAAPPVERKEERA